MGQGADIRPNFRSGHEPIREALTEVLIRIFDKTREGNDEEAIEMVKNSVQYET